VPKNFSIFFWLQLVPGTTIVKKKTQLVPGTKYGVVNIAFLFRDCSFERRDPCIPTQESFLASILGKTKLVAGTCRSLEDDAFLSRILQVDFLAR
jgi:hypothetical protein